jgi:hypothetical protein
MPSRQTMNRIRYIPFALALLLTALTPASFTRGTEASQREDATGVTRETGLAAWEEIAPVLRHPRCLNCHQRDVPLRGDHAGPHIPWVVRGEQDLGVTGMRCYGCHNEMGNNPTSGTPGAPHWQLAPESMLWEGLSAADLCEAIQDPELNGNRSLEDLIKHMQHDPLVLWGWDPGEGREPVSTPHAEFVEAMKRWVARGAPCPD